MARERSIQYSAKQKTTFWSKHSEILLQAKQVVNVEKGSYAWGFELFSSKNWFHSFEKHE